MPSVIRPSLLPTVPRWCLVATGAASLVLSGMVGWDMLTSSASDMSSILTAGAALIVGAFCMLEGIRGEPGPTGEGQHGAVSGEVPTRRVMTPDQQRTTDAFIAALQSCSLQEQGHDTHEQVVERFTAALRQQ